MTNLSLTWSNFTAAPHRVMFFGGALQIIAAMVWWLLDLVTRYGVAGQPIVWSIMPGAAHAYLMVFGLFPFFIFGFVMTTFPRWMNGKEIPAQRYVTAFVLLLSGNVIFYAGLLTHHSVLLLAVASTVPSCRVESGSTIDASPSNWRSVSIFCVPPSNVR